MKELDDVLMSLPDADTASAEYTTFNKKDNYGWAILTCSISDELLGIIENNETAKEMYDTVVGHFSKTGAVGKLCLRSEFLSLWHN